MGGSQIMRSPIGYAEEPGIYSVTDKELLKVFNLGTGIVHFFLICPILIAISNLNGTA